MDSIAGRGMCPSRGMAGREVHETPFHRDVNALWNGVFGSKQQGDASIINIDDSQVYVTPQRIAPSRADSSPAYKDQVYARSGALPGSPSARRIVEHVEPGYISERHNTRSYDGYNAYGEPGSRERREVQSHEVRIIGEREMKSTDSYYPVQTQPVAVPTSREMYLPVDNNRVQTPQRERVSRPSSQPRSDSPERVDRHDHTLYTENYFQSPQTTQVYVSSPIASPQGAVTKKVPPPSQERVLIKEVPVVGYMEKIVEVPVEKIVTVEVEKIVEKIITKEVPVEKIVQVPVEKIVEKLITKEVPVIEYRDRVVETERVVEVLVEKPVVQYRDRVFASPPPQPVTQPIRVSVAPSPQLAPQVIYAEPQVIYAEPEILRAQARVVRQQDLAYQPQFVYQPLVTYQPQRNLDLSSAQQRKHVSREELHSRADEFFHSINKAPTMASSPNQSSNKEPSIAASPNQAKAPSIASSPTLGISTLPDAHAPICELTEGQLARTILECPCSVCVCGSCFLLAGAARDPVPIQRSSIGSPSLIPSYSPSRASGSVQYVSMGQVLVRPPWFSNCCSSSCRGRLTAWVTLAGVGGTAHL